MQARTNKITHPSGITIETPLLIPSFSSKGFAFYPKSKKKDNDISEAFEALKITKEFLTESFLVSAYDIYYGHIPLTEEFICTDLTIIDSGGYETGASYDLSTVSKFNFDLKKWDKTKLIEVLTNWPEHKAAIAVSFDNGDIRLPLDQQIISASELFDKFSDMMSDFLIKPETKGQEYVQIDNILEKLPYLKSFSIIGITERELGSSILKRMENLYILRCELDKCGILSPIHVFGSLDPITTILYFLVGAEIFDGLTWLKYSYYNGTAIYTSNYGALNEELGINLKVNQVRNMSLVKNTYYLEKMKRTMIDFVKNEQFSIFDEIGGNGFGEIIEKSYRTFHSKIK
jgi:hypothetical protein